jgi:hypothetical protein
MSFLKTAFFVKNVPNGERAVRVVLSLAATAAALLLLRAPWSWLVAASSAGFGLTGVVGFCPACALAGRRLAKGH